MSDPKILIVIVVYNGAEYIGDCLSSLDACTYPKDCFDILIIDNHSSDNSLALIKARWPKIICIESKENLGFAAGNNIGFQYAIDRSYQFAYLLNQDTEVSPDFLTEAARVAQRQPSVGAVQSKLLLYGDKTKINSIGNEIHYLGFAFAGGYQLPNHELSVREIAYASGASALFSTQALKEIGLFHPEFFMYHEDTDLGWRLWLAGYTVLLAPASVVYHKYEFSKSIKKYYFMERNRYLVLLQNYKLATLLLISPALLVMDVAMALYAVRSGWWRQELAACNYFFYPKNWQRIFAARQQVQKTRRVKDRDVIKRFTGKIEFQDLPNPLLQYVGNPLFNAYWQLVKKFIWW